MKRSILFALFMLAGGVLGVLLANLFRDTRGVELAASGAVVMPHARDLAPFRLIAHDGTPFTSADLEGHWTLLFFGYTSCPDICPITMAELRRAHELLAEQREVDVRVVMVTVDPERDTPSRMERYVSGFSPEFVGVTGTERSISEFARQMHVASAKVPAANAPMGEDHLVEHSGHIVVLNPSGRYHAILKPPHRGENIASMMLAITGDS